MNADINRACIIIKSQVDFNVIGCACLSLLHFQFFTSIHTDKFNVDIDRAVYTNARETTFCVRR